MLPHTNGHQLESSSGAPLHHHVTDSGSGYPEGGGSYRKGGMQQSNGYGNHAGVVHSHGLPLLLLPCLHSDSRPASSL